MIARLRAFGVVLAVLAGTPASAHPEPARLRADVDALVAFGTRHTASTMTDDRRGIGAARNWAAARLAAIAGACGGCIAVERPEGRFAGERLPGGRIVEDVLGIQRGTGDPAHVIIAAGHIDSRNSDVMDAVGDAPGANDDGSGVALVLEAARILSRERHAATIVYAILSGEEQDLYGGTLLAQVAQRRGWRVAAMLNNDIVGNTVGQDGRVVGDRVRVFSEGARAAGGVGGAANNRLSGSEDDGPSRALAKRVAAIAVPDKKDRGATALSAMLVRRPDRFRRGGDHLPMLEAGYPAVRLTSGVENYDAQHQNPRVEAGRVYGDTTARMDFDYLARVTALNVAVMRSLAAAPSAPEGVTLGGAKSTDTVVTWSPVTGARGYRIRWRRADRHDWEQSRDVPASDTTATLRGIIVDDTFVGVSALSARGDESLVTFGALGVPAARR